MTEDSKYEALATAFLNLWEDHLRASAAGKLHQNQTGKSPEPEKKGESTRRVEKAKQCHNCQS